MEQPVGMRALQVAPHALGTEHALVERELLPRLEAHHLVPPHLELDAALLAAEAAVRLHQPVGRVLPLLVVAARRRVVEVRAVAGEELLVRLGTFRQVALLALEPIGAACPPKPSLPWPLSPRGREGRKTKTKNHGASFFPPPLPL